MALNGNGSRGGGAENVMADTPVRDPQLDAAYRAGANDGPPAAMDDAIRAAARRAVGARPGMPRSPASRWRLPLSVAAVLMLSVSLVTVMREEGHERLPSGDDLPRRVDLPEVLQSPVVTPQSEKEPPTTASSKAVLPAQTAAPPVSPASPPPVRRQAVIPPAPPASREASAGPGTPPVADGRNTLEAVALAQAEGAPSLAPRPQVFAPSALSDRAVDMQSAFQHRSAAAVAREERAPAAAAAERMQERKRLRSAPLAAAPAVPVAPASLWADLVDAPADGWLMRVRELRRAGRDADAGAVLAEFRRRFPDVELPQDLLPESGR
jgi:hypothetical protein